MIDESRIQQTLEKMLSSHITPEEVCAGDQELLAAVRLRCVLMRRVEQRIDALFPFNQEGSVTAKDGELPEINGYELISVLGRGGMGVVFKARQLKLNRLVALKTLLAGAYAGPQALERFRREAEAVAALRHPSIVQIYAVGEFAHQPFFTMEYLEGGSLAKKLDRKPQDISASVELIATLASSVQFAHQGGLIHRDLKPANILLTADGNPKITDFGLARAIAAGPELTLSGTRIGTPNYMAPEQAMGKSREIGPGVDIYSLGAILYEMLTGKPPFEGESVADTERKLVADDAEPPSRHNRQVSRDLDTICLKCLNRNSSRRYASAQDLADDLHRFLDGKPVLARPVGVWTRAIKWARRRPTLAMLILVAILAVVTGAGFSYREHVRQELLATRRIEARQAIDTGINQAYELAKSMRLVEARLLLYEHTKHLANADSVELLARLDRAKADIEFAQELVETRHLAVERYEPGQDFLRTLAKGYGTAFSKASIDVNENPATAAEHIRVSPLADVTSSALDEWAYAEYMQRHKTMQQQLLAIARLVDRSSIWREQFRDADGWGNASHVRKLATDALENASEPAPHQLLILARLLQNHDAKSDAVELLLQAIRRRPTDFWLNWELGNLHFRDRKFIEATSFFRVAVALRPSQAWSLNSLGSCLVHAHEYDEGISHLQDSLRLDPRQVRTFTNLTRALFWTGRIDEGVRTAQRAFETIPNNCDVASLYGDALRSAGRNDSAIAMYRKALAIDPRNRFALDKLCDLLVNDKRFEEAIPELERLIDVDNSDMAFHANLGIALQSVGRHSEAVIQCQLVMTALEPKKDSQDPLKPVAVSDQYIRARCCYTVSLFSMGRFAEAKTSAKLSLTHSLGQRDREETSHIESLCESLLLVEPQLPKLLAGEAHLDDPVRTLALAEWCCKYRRLPAIAVRLYEEAFKKRPSFGNSVRDRHRFIAACAAVSAVSNGDGAASPSEQEKKNYRAKALAWLRADLNEFNMLRKDNKETSAAARIATSWLKEKDLAGVRDDAAQAWMSELERKDWQELWSAVTSLGMLDTDSLLAQARAYADKMEWDKAEKYYSLLKDDYVLNSPRNSDYWFEYAAVQILAGDLAGYRKTCKQILSDPRIRVFIVARTCTLHPESEETVKLALDLCAPELKQNEDVFWSLTEAGALRCRSNQFKESIALFQKSLDTRAKTGIAVVNWIWLALAHHKLGDTDRSRFWLKKAANWLDGLGKERPYSAPIFDLHRHNWLEAMILRKEAEQLIK